MYSYNMFGLFNSVFPILFSLVFLLVFGVIIITLIKGVKQWNHNNQSPVLDVEAIVVARRTDVSYHHHHNNDNNNMMMNTSSTSYYITFQVESGDRMELGVSGSQYGQIAEGDRGKLTFQGTRFLGFERTSF